MAANVEHVAASTAVVVTNIFRGFLVFQMVKYFEMGKRTKKQKQTSDGFH